jgi:hypothetical protein
VKERVRKLRDEIAIISKQNRELMQSGKTGESYYAETHAQQRRLERLQSILNELASLTDWKKL